MKIPATGIQNNSRDIPSTIANDKHKPNNLIFSFSLAIALAFIVLIIANINAATFNVILLLFIQKKKKKAFF